MCTRKCVIPLCGFSQSSVNYRMRRYTVPCEFPHEEKCITPCGYTREKVNFPRRGNSPNFDFPHMRIYTYNCEFPLVEMHPKMRISAVRIYTFFGVLPHVEIHSFFFRAAEIRVSTCGNSHEIVYFRMWKYTKNCEFPNMRKYTFFGVFPHAEIRAGKWISACQFTSGFVNFRGEKRAGIHVFLLISACGNTRGYVNSRVRKYTRKGVLPHAVIH